jgi:hypothetical protein
MKALDALSRRIIQNLALTLGICAFLYVVGDTFHLLPAAVKEFVHFIAENFNLLAFLLCFTVGAYVLNSYLKSRNRGR